MSRQDGNILKCAQRMVKKYNEGSYSKLNGQYSKPVQVEIERMKKHCRADIEAVEKIARDLIDFELQAEFEDRLNQQIR